MKSVAPFEIGLVVRDLDAMLPFYTGVLGLSVLSSIEVPAATSRSAGLAPDGYRVVRLQTSRGDRIKLATPTMPPAPVATSDYAMQRQGCAYLTFIVDDLGPLHGRLKDAGAPIRSDDIVVLRPGVSMLLATDPEGNWIEFVHYDDLASYRAVEAKA